MSRQAREVGLRALAIMASIALATQLLGCGDDPPNEMHTVRGRITEVGAAGRTLTIDHEAVPGAMEAMQMSLPLQDARKAKGLSAGDAVEFDLYLSRGTGSIGRITKLPAGTRLQLAEPVEH